MTHKSQDGDHSKESNSLPNCLPRTINTAILADDVGVPSSFQLVHQQSVSSLALTLKAK